jgi:hypothetical protein
MERAYDELSDSAWVLWMLDARNDRWYIKWKTRERRADVCRKQSIFHEVNSVYPRLLAQSLHLGIPERILVARSKLLLVARDADSKITFLGISTFKGPQYSSQACTLLQTK